MEQKQKDLFFNCPVAGKCGGCQLQNMDYDRQLRFKQAQVIKLLGKYVHVDNIIPCDPPLHYRNKISAAFGKTRSGQIISGIYQSGSHRIVRTDSCLLENETADRIIAEIRKLVVSFKLPVYDERTGSGLIRHVMVRVSVTTDSYLVVIVTKSPVFPRKNDFIRELLKRCPMITTIVQNINPKETTMVLGDRENVLFGPGHIDDQLCGKTFRVSAGSFYQINGKQTEKLYRTAIDIAGIQPTDTVIDAYCGTGTIGIIAADFASKVIGTELNPAAVRDARKNAKLNHADNVSFTNEDAGVFMRACAKENIRPDVVITDPPRSGCSEEFLDSLIEMSPKKVVYISCNPETQARDLAILIRAGYKAKKCIPVDMFPFTKHVETVVLLSRK